MEKEIFLNGRKYQVICDEDGEKFRRFDTKHKMWVTLSFSKNPDPHALEIMSNLSMEIYAGQGKGIMLA